MANLRANKITTGTADYQGSIYASGTGAYLLTTTTAPGTDDFTIECWINSNDAGGTNQEGLFTINAQSDGTSGFQAGTSNQLRLVQGRDGTDGQNGGLEVNIVGTVVGTGDGNDIIQEGTWHHVAVTRASGTVKIWVDGVEKASGSAAGDVTGTTFLTGYYDQNYTYQGYMSNFRYRKGTAHYTTTFTPPTGPLERTSDTELLFAQSANNAGDGYSSAIHGGTTDIMKVLGNVTANTSAPTLTTSSSVGVVFEGDTKVNTQGYMYFPTGDTSQRGRGRGIFGGGYKSPFATADNLNSLEYFNIQSTGNAVDFGDRTVVMSQGMATVASSTRGVMMGGRGYNYPASPTSTSTDTIDYVTIATTANATDFGNLVHGSTYISAAGGNSTRGVLFRSSDGDMEYITIATTGNSVDTGSDSTVGRNTFSGSASQTRAFWAGGANPSGGAAIATIDYLEIASLGVPQDFGDLTFTGHNQAASSNTRGIIFTGGFPSAASNVINYITIASTGNATDFGDLPANITSHTAGSGVSNSIRAVRCGGYLAPTSINRIDYVTISTTGNAQDFGDLITIRQAASGFSDSHGGL